MRRALALALALSAGLVPRASGEELLVFAAASLSDVLTDLGRSFEDATGRRVRFSFAGSGDLARQIRAGAPADVFFSADRERMAELERAGLVRPEERRDVLSNALVVVVPARSNLRIGSAADLARVARIALADPEIVPAGAYARRWLESEGVWQAVRDRAVPTLDVRAALGAVEAGHAEAGVVYRTDGARSTRVRVVHEAPPDRAPRIVYPLAPIASSRQPARHELVRFLVSDAAREAYRRYGFIVLESP